MGDVVSSSLGFGESFDVLSLGFRACDVLLSQSFTLQPTQDAVEILADKLERWAVDVITLRLPLLPPLGTRYRAPDTIDLSFQHLHPHGGERVHPGLD